MRIVITVLLLFMMVGCARSVDDAPVQVVASPVSTDIWVAELLDSGRRLRVGTPVNVTDRPGYDNQPFFLPDGSGLLYTSTSESGQTDVHLYEFERARVRRLTRTVEAEYSPTPLADGGFAVVRVEQDTRQRLWRFDDGGRNPELLLADVEPVGYMAWLDADRVAVFVLGEPPTLQLVDLRDGSVQELLRSVGRSLHPVPGEDMVSAVHKVSDEEWNIVAFDADGSDPVWLAPALRPSEDFAWTTDGQLIMGRGAKLYIRRPGEGQEWMELADLSAHGIEQISRLAVSPNNDRIAIVGQR